MYECAVDNVDGRADSTLALLACPSGQLTRCLWCATLTQILLRKLHKHQKSYTQSASGCKYLE